MNIFGNRVDILRKEHNLNQAELAKKFGVTKSAISNWKCLGKQPSQETLIGLASFFETSVDYLVGKSDIRNEISEKELTIDVGTKSFAAKLITELLKNNTIETVEDITPALVDAIIFNLKVDIENRKKDTK